MKNLSKKIPLIVLTDISTDSAERCEPDDTQSLIRLLLYSDCFDIKGLVATYTPHCGRACPEYIKFAIDNYKKVYPNLMKIGRPFATPEDLYATVKKGSDTAGDGAVGPDRSTEGSKWITEQVISSDEPVWITVWGGVTDLMQAILDAKASLGETDFLQFCRKIRVYSIDDQYDESGKWIRENCPEIFYITAYHCFRGIYRMGNTRLCDENWVRENVTNVGALGRVYPNYNGGDAYIGEFGPVKGVKEGDTTSFFHLLPNGLCDPMHPEYGSWGGVFEMREPNRYFDTPVFYENQNNCWAAVYKHRPDFQNDFAVRMKWSAGEMANVDYPQITLNTEATVSVKRREETVITAETDICCDLSWQYCPEAGDFDGVLHMTDMGDERCRICPIPNAGTDYPKTAHVIVRAATKTSPYLVCYKRVIVNIL